MKCNRNAAVRYAAVLLMLPALLVAGCEQRNKQQNQQQHNPQAAQQQFTGKGHARLREACADDIQKYCANADRKRRCLRENMDKLSDACKAAVGQRGGRRAREQDGGDE
jgi:hypothetical protein